VQNIYSPETIKGKILKKKRNKFEIECMRKNTLREKMLVYASENGTTSLF
jgi:hypothetical protein